ncbi:MAG: protein TolR [Deltaproteobacteria bacterium]|nr:protein TolR [Deltaproteobacteria bacterium]MBK9644691.1 protein TolR [Deltaproteobacteria bacterium]
MGMSSGGDRGGMMAEINVTPFVDVMLVLLIIFMVTAPMMVQGVDIELPKSQSPPLVSEEEQLVLSLTADGKYFINESEFTFEELQVKLRAIREANPDQAIFVKADGALPYEKVIRMMSVAQAAGIGKVGLVTQPGAASE